jgi:hypothetical protein
MLYDKLNTSRSKIYSLNELAQSDNDGRSIPKKSYLTMHLDPNVSTTSGKDISGNGNDATFYGGDVFELNGLQGKAFRLYSTDYMVAPRPEILTPVSGSMFAWVQFNDVVSRQTIFSGYDGGSSNRWDFELSSTTDTDGVTHPHLDGLHHDTGFTESDPLDEIRPGLWYFVGFTCNNNDWAHLYLNGRRVGTAAANRGLANGTSQTGTGIGRRISQANFPTHQYFGEVFSWSAELTNTEVKELYEATRSRYESPRTLMDDSLVVHLDAGISSSYNTGNSVWNDLSGNGNNASLTNNSYGDGDGANVQFRSGSSAYGEITYDSSTMDWSNGVTVVAVLKPQESTHVRPFINHQNAVGDGSGQCWRFLMASDNVGGNTFQFDVTFDGGGTYGIKDFNRSFSVGKHYFLGFSVPTDGSAPQMWINNYFRSTWEYGSGGNSGGILQGTGPMYININDSYSPDRYGSQDAYVYLVFNRTLSKTEMSELYNYYRAQYQFNDYWI